MSTPTLSATSLAVGYGGHRVIDEFNVTLRSAEMLLLIGTNGSGKSTLLKTFGGLQDSLGGRVEILGAKPGHRPVDVAYLCQSPPSSFTLPVRASDIVLMGRYARLGLLGRPSRVDRNAVDRAIELMGVGPFAHKPLRELSGGQQQRVHLAQTFARESQLLLLDEPTAGLDAAGRQTFADALASERARGCAVVMATHDIEDAAEATQVVLLAGGIVAQGHPTDVLTDANLRACSSFTGRHHGEHHDHDHAH